MCSRRRRWHPLLRHSSTPPWREPGEADNAACRFGGASFDVKIEGDMTMRFMMIVKASEDSEAGIMPSEDLLSAIGKYNEELMKAGVLLDGAGLQPSSKGARIKFSGVIDGPFAETKELITGYWIIQVKSR